ncbi:endo alpha-1,4 polygalactosaminidase [bacterium]|nr:endo alpha-1,4 polygalactosaminidase [bacterium]
MKHLCCSKIIIFSFFLYTSLLGALNDKSAILYYGEDISYPMVGIHDYIIVQPDKINTSTHGFSIYKDKMYAYISIGEISPNTKEYKNIHPSWVLTENKLWNSKVLDINNKKYQEFLLSEMIKPRIEQGFRNFFFDTLDSYQLHARTLHDRQAYETALAEFIHVFHTRFPHARLIINRGFEIIDKVHDSLEAVLFESYHFGLGGKKVSASDKRWLDTHIDKIRSYGLPLISVDYLEHQESAQADEAIKIIHSKGMIPYVATRDLDTYGKSSKNALKREILVMVDESKNDRINLSAHQYGALPLEYAGYIQKLYDINKGLPEIERMGHYAGVVVWLDNYYENPKALLEWIIELHKSGIKTAFVDNFGSSINYKSLALLGIDTVDVEENAKNAKEIILKDKMIGYEMQPSLVIGSKYLQPKNAQPLIIYKDENNLEHVPAALTPWGGYAVDGAFMIKLNEENIWVVNPFEFFIKALELKPLLVPDTTTENGNRLLFSHIDGDGIMNRAEWNPNLFSGEVILKEILQRYKIPHSVSVIGAEIDAQGLFPELSADLISLVKEIYALENVEGATHTFTHPFIWGMIENDTLDEKYRLKVKDYRFSIDREIGESLKEINTKLSPLDKPKANTVFWSGDCAPTQEVLKYIYENGILNINGGDTMISNTTPWLTYIAPIGIERGAYYQIYTGAQNENIYTNNWLGPFWGFKKVVQTFKLTNTPRRLKPIDIYYHIYSGSKRASLNALKYVFDWAIKEDVLPIFTSEYIHKAMDFYTVSIANEENRWLVSGMKSLRTLRAEDADTAVDIYNSAGVLGIKHIQERAYIHLDNSAEHLIALSAGEDVLDRAYLIDANAEVVKNGYSGASQNISFRGHVDLKLRFHVPKNCKIASVAHADKIVADMNDEIVLYYKNTKQADINVTCK